MPATGPLSSILGGARKHAQFANDREWYSNLPSRVPRQTRKHTHRTTLALVALVLRREALQLALEIVRQQITAYKTLLEARDTNYHALPPRPRPGSKVCPHNNLNQPESDRLRRSVLFPISRRHK